MYNYGIKKRTEIYREVRKGRWGEMSRYWY